MMIASGKEIKEMCVGAGAAACGVVRCEPVSCADWELFTRWRELGRHAGMEYMERYDEVRRDPRLLLEGARSMAVCLFDYSHPMPGYRLIAEYARGEDYHIAIRRRLQPVCDTLRDRYGVATRICTDSAPLRERYWAVRAGLGFTGRNGQLIVPGRGMHFNIAILLLTCDLDHYDDKPPLTPNPSTLTPPLSTLTPPPSTLHPLCGLCRKCVDACPGHALDGTGAVDARRCLSYLTIESRDPLPAGTRLCGQMFGCDICRRVCPHEPPAQPAAPASTSIAVTAQPAARAVAPSLPAMTDLTPEDWQTLPTNQLRRIIAATPLTRVPIPRLRYLASQMNISR